MTALLAPLLYSLGPLGLMLVVAVVFAETGLLAGFFLPGDSMLFLAGALVATHVLSLPVPLVAGAVLVAAVAGDQVGFLVGRRLGPRLFSRPDSRLFRQEHVERATAFFEQHGGRAVVLARFVPVVRTFVPGVAGVARMPHRRFTAFNLVGAAVWGVGLVLTGYFFGGIPFVAAHVELITIGIAALSVVPVALGFLRRRRGTGGTGGDHAAAAPSRQTSSV